MNWRKIAEAFKRLDDHLSDSVYLHGCYLTGQEKIISPHRQRKARDRLQEASTAMRGHMTTGQDAIFGK